MAVARPAGATITGTVSPATRLRVTVTLKPRDPAALAAYARAVSTPGSSNYRRYLTPAEFGRRFGATPAQVAVVRESLRARGLRPGPASAGALSVPVSATAALLERAFSISLQTLALPGRLSAIAASRAPAIGASAAAAIQSVVGLSTVSAPHPLLVRAPGTATRDALAGPHVATGGPQPCAAALSAAPSQTAYTADQIASAYGFSGLYKAGVGGAGVTVAVYELEPHDSADIAAYQACYGTHATITNVAVDGGTGGGAGTGEAALDIENLIGLAPNVNVLVYQGPNSNSGNPGSGPYDTFSTIINQDRARVVSVSWGQCESALGQPDAAAENTLFQQATVQGQSIVAAAGDSGAEDCDNGGAPSQTQAAVDDPSSQPYVTGVGGTSLQALGPRPTESVWNSGGTAVSGTIQPGAGGGGISTFWPMPAAQADAAAALGVRSPVAAGSNCGSAGGYCRAVPDVSADADPSTGYLIYWNGGGSVTGQPSGWQGIGGTSGTAPLWSALLALADASPACATSPVGYADPALYRAASTSYAADFNDVTTGNNDFTGTNGGRYAATPGYDPASGLGTPNAAALAASLCADTVRLASPGQQRSTVRTSVLTRIRGSDTAGAAVTYSASGLPPGLGLEATTGTISGRPSRTGSFPVRITASDGEGSSASVTFPWLVAAGPKISQLSLTRTGGGPELSFTVTAARNAPALQGLALTVPPSLRVASRRGVRVTSATGKPVALRFTDRASPTTLTVNLRRPADSVRVRLGPPSLTTRGGRLAAAALPGGTRLKLILHVTDANAGRSDLTAKVTARP
jgi:subtilase family serine protease